MKISIDDGKRRCVGRCRCRRHRSIPVYYIFRVVAAVSAQALDSKWNECTLCARWVLLQIGMDRMYQLET